MKGYLPAQTDKYFVVNGTKFHYGEQGGGDDGIYITMVREAIPGGGVYVGTNAVKTWKFVCDVDVSLMLYQMRDEGLTIEEELNRVSAEFNRKANLEISEFTGGTGGTLPPFPTDLYQQVKWYVENKIAFDPAKNQMVFLSSVPVK